MHSKLAKSSRAARASGFTMIEILTVLAIIAILAAVIYPIFATILENGRQSTSISNLHDISTKVAQYELDNHKAPPVLFGYIYCQDKTPRGSHAYIDANTVPVPMDKALAQAESNYKSSTNPTVDDPANWFPGLYPTYIKDIAQFKDSNNQEVNDTSMPFSGVTAPNVNVLCPDEDDACPPAVPNATHYDLVKALHTHTETGNPVVYLPRGYYIADAYDVCLKVVGPNALADPASVANAYVPRFQYAWTAIDKTLACKSEKLSTDAPTQQEIEGRCVYRRADPTNPASTAMVLVDDKYLHQIHWKSPPPRTYVTCTTYHVPQTGKILVLSESGNVRKVGYDEFTEHGPDADTIIPTVASPDVSQARFWTVTP
jgi:prepilin-type N-terminal cleavage/methylation domain-containing protein